MQIKKRVITILDFLVEKGSVTGYLLRESICNAPIKVCKKFVRVTLLSVKFLTINRHSRYQTT
jgi:hypothetical protein